MISSGGRGGSRSGSRRGGSYGGGGALDRRTTRQGGALLGVLLCIAASVPYWSYTDGDASIYFAFLKGFFDKPFSYAPGVVSFGATSPLHVLVFAPIHHLFGAEWIYVAKVLNPLLVLTGAWMIGRSTRHPLGMLGALAAVAATPQLMENTFDLFEVGVVFLVGAGCVAALVEERWRSALLWAGFAYLARPELVLAAAGAVVYVGSCAGRRAPWAFLLPGLIATTGYHWWMASQGAGWLPTSVTGRLHRVAGEAGGSWTERFAGSFAPRWVHPSGLGGEVLVLLALAAIGLVVLLPKRNKSLWPALAYAGGVLAVYVVFPPSTYAARYLLAVAPCLVLLVAKLFEAGSSLRIPGWAPALSCLLALATVRYAWGLPPRWPEHVGLWSRDLARFRGYEPAADLSDAIAGLAAPGERVLVYEIQSQYGSRARLVSMDAIVGGEAAAAYARREEWTDFVVRSNVRWVVINQAQEYRPAYRGTVLHRMYQAQEEARRDGSPFEVGVVEVADGAVVYRLRVLNRAVLPPPFGSMQAEPPVLGEREGGLERGIPAWESIWEVTLN
ncbi:MAG: hypothetical protein AMXMBFR81_02100 [Chthonomonas sp.]